MLMRFIQNLWLALLVPSFSYSAGPCPPNADKTAVVGKVEKGENQDKFKKLLLEQQALIAHAISADLPIIFIQIQPGGDTFKSLTDKTKDYAKTDVLLKTADGMLDEKSLCRDQTIR